MRSTSRQARRRASLPERRARSGSAPRLRPRGIPRGSSLPSAAAGEGTSTPRRQPREGRRSHAYLGRPPTSRRGNQAWRVGVVEPTSTSSPLRCAALGMPWVNGRAPARRAHDSGPSPLCVGGPRGGDLLGAANWRPRVSNAPFRRFSAIHAGHPQSRQSRVCRGGSHVNRKEDQARC